MPYQTGKDLVIIKPGEIGDESLWSYVTDKEQGAHEALLGRQWLQPGWFMIGLKVEMNRKDKQVGKEIKQRSRYVIPIIVHYVEEV